MAFSLDPGIIRIAADVLEKLTDLGYSSEGWYVLGETIEATRTRGDLSEMIQGIVPTTQRVAQRWHDRWVTGIRESKWRTAGATDASAMGWVVERRESEWRPGSVTQDEFSNLFKNVLGMRDRHVATRAVVAGMCLSYGTGGLYNKRPPVHWYEDSNVFPPLFHEQLLVYRNVYQQLTQFGTHLLEQGHSEGVFLLGTACRLKMQHHDPLTPFENQLGRIFPRQIPPVPAEEVARIAIIAREFADAGRFSSAVGLALIIPMLASWSSEPALLYDSPGQRLLAVAHQSSAWRLEAEKSVVDRATDLSRRLLKLGYPAAAAELYQVALDLPESEPRGWEPVWNFMNREILGKVPEARSDESSSWTRAWRPASMQGRVPYMSGPDDQPVQFEKVLTDLAAADTSASHAAPEPVEQKQSVSSRCINAWLEDGDLPLQVGVTYKMGVNIGEPKTDAMSHTEFTEPDWGGQEELEIIIALNGEGIKVKPAWQTATLPKQGEMDPVEFHITPESKGSLDLYLSIFLARELTLLEELCITLEVIPPTLDAKL